MKSTEGSVTVLVSAIIAVAVAALLGVSLLGAAYAGKTRTGAVADLAALAGAEAALAGHEACPAAHALAAMNRTQVESCRADKEGFVQVQVAYRGRGVPWTFHAASRAGPVEPLEKWED